MADRANRKPEWIIAKEKARRPGGERLWLFGLHAVRDALLNKNRRCHRLIVTRNAADKLAEAIAQAGLEPEIADPRRFSAPIDSQSVHQGAALEVSTLIWGDVTDVCVRDATNPLVLFLDRVTDPHNVGAILRSAEVFGAAAVIAPRRHAAPETGALAKSASGALERQPYLRVPNLVAAIGELRAAGYRVIGLDGAAEQSLPDAVHGAQGTPLAIVLGAEGPGLRPSTKDACDSLAAIPGAGTFASLNVSNAAAISLYVASGRQERLSDSD